VADRTKFSGQQPTCQRDAGNPLDKYAGLVRTHLPHDLQALHVPIVILSVRVYTRPGLYWWQQRYRRRHRHRFWWCMYACPKEAVMQLSLTERASLSHFDQWSSCFDYSLIIMDCWRKLWDMLCAESYVHFLFSLKQYTDWYHVCTSCRPTQFCLQINIKNTEDFSARWAPNHHLNLNFEYLEYIIM
jgi:hypothetical protein